ncbi:hypothetical protein F4809DRAFT_633677 [Biscogniauxia mediterranea]|nr:hypothetical protein F4809DRAFT_633677 [Biscogniauxia mediterranea]
MYLRISYIFTLISLVLLLYTYYLLCKNHFTSDGVHGVPGFTFLLIRVSVFFPGQFKS